MSDHPATNPRKINDAAGQQILLWLEEAGASARYVGGCVRDHLIKRPFYDVDIATSMLPEDVMALMEGFGVKVIPTGLKHGTVTLIYKGETFEVTTLRKDVETDGRHAIVDFTDDWEMDAARRDLTMNAMSMDRQGDLFDPYGGQADLKAGIIRFVGRPVDRIQEDYLRLLRFFRFSAHYGKANPDPDLLEIFRSLKDGLAGLSCERVREELLKLLTAPQASKWIKVMDRSEILGEVLPEFESVEALDMLSAFEEKPDPLRRLMVIVKPDQIIEMGKRLKFSNKDLKMFQAVRSGLKDITTLQSIDKTRAQIYEFGSDNVEHAFYLFCAEKGFQMLNPNQDPHFIEIQKWRDNPIEFPIKGSDLQELGVQAGPEMGQLLKTVEAWWKDQGCRTGHEACLDYARSIK